MGRASFYLIPAFFMRKDETADLSALGSSTGRHPADLARMWDRAMRLEGNRAPSDRKAIVERSIVSANVYHGYFHAACLTLIPIAVFGITYSIVGFGQSWLYQCLRMSLLLVCIAFSGVFTLILHDALLSRQSHVFDEAELSGSPIPPPPHWTDMGWVDVIPTAIISFGVISIWWSHI